MEPEFIAKNAGARICVFEKYITIKESLFSKDVMIPFKEISSVESGILGLKINTKDRNDYRIALKSDDKEKIKNLIFAKLTE